MRFAPPAPSTATAANVAREQPALWACAEYALSRRWFRAWLGALIVTLTLFACGAPAAVAQAGVAVRFGDHRGYARLVFEFRRPVAIRVEKASRPAIIAIAAPLHVDLAHIAAAGSRVLAASATIEGRRTIIRLTLAKNVTLRYFRDGPHLVVDAVGPVTQQAAVRRVERPRPVRKTATKAARRKPIQPRRKLKMASSTAVPPAAAATTATAPPMRIVAPRRRHAPSASRAANDATPENTATTASQVVAGTMTVGVVASPSGMQLSFPWPAPVDAAVFERAGWLWIVFDHPAHLDVAAIARHGMPVVWQPEQIADTGATILRMRIGPGWVPMVGGSSNESWQIALVRAAAAKPPQSIPVWVKPTAAPPQILLAVREAGRIVTLTDPAVGDRLSVVTVGKPGLGLAAPRSFAQFSLLEAAQGLAVVKASDHVNIAASPDGIALTATGGLLLSQTSPTSRTSQSEPDVFFQFRHWVGPPERFEATKQKLQLALVQAPPGGLADGRYALAEFFFANGFYAEAEGVLDRLVARAPMEATRPRFELLHGAVLFGLRRFKEAEAELDKANIAQRPEAALWFGAAKAAQRDWKSALASLRHGSSVLEAYPPRVRARFELALAHAELGTGDPGDAQTTLIHLRKDDPDPATEAESYFLSGVAAQRLAKLSEADTYYRKAEASPIVPVHARGEMALVLLALDQGRTTKPAAIKRLESLRYLWRGGAFEDRLLRYLGGFYLGEHHYRKAFTTWKTVIDYFPDYPNTPKLKKQMKTVFLQLFLKGGADRLSALKAIGLFYDFRDLTPNDANGDAIVRRLARRLVSVDLLSQAEDLLHYQMTYRLAAGTEKARVGVQLGKVYLLDQRPKMTLATLTDSETAGLPADLVEQRRNLRVAALIELERYNDALQALTGATDATAVSLRAGIYWRARNWPEEISALTQILGNRYAEHKPLSADKQLDVLRLAVALAMSGNDSGLAQLRKQYAPLLVNTPQAEAFRAVTEKIGVGNGLPTQDFLANLDQLQGFLAHYGLAQQNAG